MELADCLDPIARYDVSWSDLPQAATWLKRINEKGVKPNPQTQAQLANGIATQNGAKSSRRHDMNHVLDEPG